MVSIPEYAIKNRSITWFMLLLFIFGGVYGFMKLGKKEDSTFVIKSASILCYYPGATPAEVEMLITEPIERELQTIRKSYKITSDSGYGISKILIELDPSTPPEEIPQLWDELRRKVLNIQPQLPSGASEIIVSDDFGDLYGIYYALSASDGFSFSELREWAQLIKRRLLSIDGVQKVSLYGEQNPVVNIYVSLSGLSNFSIRPEAIVSTIARQNGVVSSGEKEAGMMQIRIVERGSYESIQDIRDQLLSSSDGRQFRLGDIARVEQEYASPPTSIMRVDGRRAIGVGVSTADGYDVVATGAKIRELLQQMEGQMPLGLELEVLYPEDQIAREATSAFLVNLLVSIAIVIVVIMLIMGLRAGVLIGSSLLFSIGGTLLSMLFVGEGLNRTSLAGFIIAMGMLVDNAIVVVDNAQNAIARGVDPRRAVVEGADAPKWSLLGATLIAIFSFLPLYLAPSSVAEIVKPLFVVLAISLLMSWILALTQTPLFASALLQKRESGGETTKEPTIYRLFGVVLQLLLRHKWVVLFCAIAALFGSIKIMERMPQNFFPSLDKPYFRADVILPDGYNIEATQQQISHMERWLERQSEVKRVSSTAGGTPPRYYIASGAVALMPNFGNILVELYSSRESEDVESRFSRYVRDSLPDVWLRSSLFKLSPAPDATIEMGFIGSNIDTLTRLTHLAEQIMWEDRDAINIRNSWGNRVPTWHPLYSQMRGGRIGISRRELSQGLTVATVGYTLGEYRQGDQFMPILMRDADLGRYNLANLETLPLFSPSGRLFSVEQATSGFSSEYNIPLIRRYNRERVMKAQCDPAPGVNTKELYNRILSRVEAEISLPPGYEFRVFGEEESQSESNDALAENFPLTIVLIFITLLLLFGTYREPAVILMMIPLIFIGVVLGLWVSGRMFDFFALLGVLGLVGMNIKNGVVLVARIKELRGAGVSPDEALLEATKSRIIPVTMASATTILGMIPLLFDSLFAAMAAAIMGGLVVATLLTFCVLPACYAILYNIKFEKQ